MLFKIVSFLSTAIFLVLSACACQQFPKLAEAQTPPTPAAKSTAATDTAIPDDMAGYSIPASQRVVKSKDLYEALAKVDRLKTSKFSEVIVTAYDVFCEVNPTHEKLLCRANTRPENTKGGQRVDFNAADSEKIFQLLTYMPIHKGDSGLSTEFVQCRQTKIDAGGTKYQYGCSVAAPIQYVPHSGMSPLVEGED